MSRSSKWFSNYGCTQHWVDIVSGKAAWIITETLWSIWQCIPCVTEVTWGFGVVQQRMSHAQGMSRSLANWQHNKSHVVTLLLLENQGLHWQQLGVVVTVMEINSQDVLRAGDDPKEQGFVEYCEGWCQNMFAGVVCSWCAPVAFIVFLSNLYYCLHSNFSHIWAPSTVSHFLGGRLMGYIIL